MSSPGPASASARLQLLASAVLVCLGLSSSAGYLLESPALLGLGRLSSASPLPLVFGKVRGLEYWRLHGRLELRMSDGRRHDIEVSARHFQAISGTHRVKVLYAVPFSLTPVTDRALWEPPLRHGLCRSGSLHSAFDIEGKVAMLRLTLWQGQGDSERRWVRELTC